MKEREEASYRMGRGGGGDDEAENHHHHLRFPEKKKKKKKKKSAGSRNWTNCFCYVLLFGKGAFLTPTRRTTLPPPNENILAPPPRPPQDYPTTNGGMHSGRSVGMRTLCIHVFFFARFGADLYAQYTKFLHRSPFGSLLRVRCWLGTTYIQ